MSEGYEILTLDEVETASHRGSNLIPVRHTLGFRPAGVNGWKADTGGQLIPPHEEDSGNEELYVVVQGDAKFTLDGEEVDAPNGTVVFVQPGAKRKAVATTDDTIVLAVGGRRGEAYRLPPGAELFDFFEHYNAKDYEGALAACHVALEKYPGNALILYNIACTQSLLGRSDESLETLRTAIDGWPKFKENAQKDDDFTSLREDARFLELVG
jgi:mannose-6-phosphate isomerase-like protein (cupin superfamily)